MKLNLVFNDIEPLDRNNALAYSKGRLIKATKHRKYTADLQKMLLVHFNELRAFDAAFMPREHAIKASYEFHWPSSKILRKDKAIKCRRHDVDNYSKSIQDVIFDNFEKADDSAIVDLFVKKRVSKDDKYQIIVTLELISLEEVHNLS